MLSRDNKSRDNIRFPLSKNYYDLQNSYPKTDVKIARNESEILLEKNQKKF